MTVKEVTTKKERREFFRFPLKLYKGNAYAVPQLISDENDEFNPAVNDAYSYAESKMFLCYDDNGKVVGRIAAILNKAYNAKQNVKQLRFSRYDVIDDFAVTKALFEPVKKWAEELGMDEIVGPIGFSDLDKQGMLIEGFDRDDMYLTIYNYPYYAGHMERLGMQKSADWVEYRIAVPTEPDERLYRIADMVAERSGFEYYEIKNFKSVEPVIHRALKQIMNEVFAHLYGVVEITDRQIKREADMLKQVWVNDFVTAVKNREGEVIGYGFMAPSVSKTMRKMNGRLTLGGIFQLMHDLRHPEVVDLYSIGVRKEYQNSGVNAMIMARSLKSLLKHKVKFLETGPELETNVQIQAQWKKYDKEQHRRRRCWSLKLADNADEQEKE